jgi:RNA polymerase sigma factor (sigma-70 family)
MVLQLLQSLDERGQAVIRHRFGIGNSGSTAEPLTLNETGKELGVSDERIRQLEKNSLTKLNSKIKKK